jgi:hypothetical protein
MHMPMLERRVQVLFDQASYDCLAAAAKQEGRSVGSLVREAVDESLRQRSNGKRAALTRLLSIGDRSNTAQPEAPPLTLKSWLATKNDIYGGS